MHFQLVVGLPAVVLALFCGGSWAQTPSSSWRKSNITTAPADRASIAAGALQEALSQLGTDGQFDGQDYIFPAIFYSQMAGFDIATSGSQYEETLQKLFPLAQNGKTNFTDPKLYGYAAALAYKAYNNPTFLQYAVESWWVGRQYTPYQADIDAGKIGTKNFPLAKTCQGATMAGGTFGSTDASDTSISGLPTGHFGILSALLAEATSDSMYLEAAQLSTQFMHAQLLDVGNVVQDGISGRANDSCAVSTLLEPYDSGELIEALSVLLSISNDTATETLLASIIQATIVSNQWQGANGIISNVGHGSGGDLFVVRGLTAAYARNVTSPALHSYIQAYLAVQYNAVLDLATTAGSNIYGIWIGPATSFFSASNQTAALSPLISALSLHNATDTASASASASGPATASSTSTGSASNSNGNGSNTTSSAPAHKATPTAAIAGGIVGGLALIALCAGLCFWVGRRRPSRRFEETPQTPMTILSDGATGVTSSVSPFTEGSSISPTTISSPGREYSSAAVPVIREKGPLTPLRSRFGRSPSDDTAASTAGSQVSLSTAAAPPQRSAVSSSTLPTEELVRVLNERLQNQAWDATEAPPQYPETVAGE